ncbi:MAG: Single-stranded-DNA-specific exonuclease RecJ [Legionellaceae bacterium]
MQKRIVRRKIDYSFLRETSLHPILQRIYNARGITCITELDNNLNQLDSFHTLKGINSAVEILSNALQKQEKILIIGDFDADGATSTALAVSALRAFGAKEVNYLVPNRFDYGYGLTPEIVEVAAKQKPDIIMTVDNGIASCEGVLLAKKLGIKVIITDHHLPGKELPNADAIVNPNQSECPFPSKNSAGVGVIFYVMLALRSQLREINWFDNQHIIETNMGQFLDLVALGTFADVVPLDKNNRILVHQGVQRIRTGKCRPGILELIKIAKRDYHTINASDLGFAIAPRLNAAGRLDDMSLGIECLLTENPTKAKSIAEQLNLLNQERRLIEAEMQQQADNELAKLNLTDIKNLPYGICLFNEQWHQGVIGILAGRLKDRLHRPTIIFALANDNVLKGSARSINGIHIRDVLDYIATTHPDLITKFGGHAMAAGLSIHPENYPTFATIFDQEIQKKISADNLYGKIDSDGELEITDFNIKLAYLLRESGPWGQNFPEPIFDGKFKVLEQRLINGKHLKLLLTLTNDQMPIDAIAFNIDNKLWPNHGIQYIKAAYKLEINEFRGMQQLQLLIEYLEPDKKSPE